MAQAFNLQIQSKLKTKDMKIIGGIAQFVENSEIMRYELEKRSLRAAKEVAPDRSGGLKKAIEISKSTPNGYTLGVSDNIISGEEATKKTIKYTSTVGVSTYSNEAKIPKRFKPREIKMPSRYLETERLPKSLLTTKMIRYGNRFTVDTSEDPYGMFIEKSPAQYAAELKAYNQAKADELERVAQLRNTVKIKKGKKTKSFKKGKTYNEYLDGGSKVRANMQEFGYPYKTRIWGPYKPNPKAPKGPKGLGYLRLGQVLAAKSLLKDYVDYSVSVSAQEVIYYEKTIENEMSRAYTKLLAKYLRGQKLPPYYKGIDKIKQKAPIPERALAYGSVTNINIDLPLSFPRNPYTLFETGGKLAGIRNSVNERPFQAGFSFLIDDD